MKMVTLLSGVIVNQALGLNPGDFFLLRGIEDLVPEGADGNSEGQAGTAREPFKKARLVMEVFFMSCPPFSSFEEPF